MTPEHGIQERARYDFELDEMINVNIDSHVKPCQKGKRKNGKWFCFKPFRRKKKIF